MTLTLRLLSALIILILMGGSFGSEKPTSTRDKLFKCSLMSWILDRECLMVLHRIGLTHAENFSFPLGTIPRIDSAKKNERDLFMKAIVVTVNCVNKIILRQRELVQLARNRKKRNLPLSNGERQQFDMICEFYQSKNIDELLVRVAPVPVSLAVAQASLESRFGEDRIIHAQKAYFGLAKTKDTLLSFDSLYKSAIAYAKTLNVNHCYAKFRKERAAMIAQSQKIDGAKLSPSLGLYGVDKNYRNLVLKIIKSYGLTSLDRKV
ncbi:MAG: glucosaminidase domain-containing protein [Holosporaceae bacterium]|jgi:uncharacterized FlgJ-related protein|nr:glucosaminidase domain-containing protein [Holosporaceae bacterium]